MDNYDKAKLGFATLIDVLQKEVVIGSRLNKIECDISKSCLDIVCNLLQGYVDGIVATDLGNSVVSADGSILNHRRKISRTILTRYGEITITRTGYSLRGRDILFPHDAVLNLPASRYSYCLQEFVAKESAKAAYDGVIASVADLFNIKLGKPQVVEIVQYCAQYFDAFYKLEASNNQVNITPQHLLVLTTDGKGVVMRSSSLREATRKRKEASNSIAKARLARGEKANAKRMAQVASIYYIDPYYRTVSDIIDGNKSNTAEQQRPKPIAKKVWASLEKSSTDVISNMFDQALKQDPDNKHQWVILVDGQTTQIKQIKKALKKIKKNDIPIILDIIHAIEYLWKAAYFFHKDGTPEAEEWVKNYLTKLLTDGGKKTAMSIRMSAAKKLITSSQQKVKEITKYLFDRDAYTKYSQYLKIGYPIATGIIEGACRYLIKDRMDITGARWGLKGAEAVLQLRSLINNKDFNRYWAFYIEQEFQRLYVQRFKETPKWRD